MNIATLFVLAMTIVAVSATAYGDTCVWGPWSNCQGAPCGEQGFRARYVQSAPAGCNRPEMDEDRDPNPCTVMCSTTSCQGHWEIGGCASNGQCGSPAGTRTDVFTVTTPQGPGGFPCEANNGETRQTACNDAPVTACSVNCEGQWENQGQCQGSGRCGDGNGRITQVYTITRNAENGGQQCEAYNGATREQPCYVQPTPCQGCEGSWTDGPCNSNGQCGSPSGTRVQTYHITRQAEEGGAQCETTDGNTRTVPCENADVTPCVGCEGSWGNPGPCISRGQCDSNNGYRVETYTITREAGPGGAACEATNGQTRETYCAAEVTYCVHCAGNWENNGQCESAGHCGSDEGYTTETFKITQQAGPGGRGCDAQDGQTRITRCSAAVRDCQGCVGDFGEYSQCEANAPCGTTQGRRSRTYTHRIPAEAGGTPCPYYNGQVVTEDCPVAMSECVHCQGSFSDYTTCASNGVCGSPAGKRSRTFTITTEAGPGGNGCAFTNGQVVEENCDNAEVRECQGCVGAFEETECTSRGICDSDAGFIKRTYKITQQAEPGGVQCPHKDGFTDRKPCKAAVTACVHCVGAWSEFGTCVSNGVCGSDAGYQTRTYTITTPAGKGGRACPAKNGDVEKQACSALPVTPCPPEDCEGSFGPMSECKVTGCGTSVGTQSRTFTITKNLANGGKACEYQNGFVETTPCDGKLTPCPVNCVGEWTTGTCTPDAPCGTITGKRVNTYAIIQAAAHYGTECPNKQGDQETVACTVPKVDCPPEDCVGSWGGESECVVPTCGITAGRRTKRFSVSREARYNGKVCEASNGEVREEDCVGTLKPCPVDCQGTWSGFSPCKSNDVCGSSAGTRSRTYSVITPNKYGGAKCSVEDSKVETEACEALPIVACPPEDCKFEWSPYAPCKAKGCGSTDGTTSRVYTIKSAEKYNGKACEYTNGFVLESACQVEKAEPCPINCEGTFNDWTTCSSYKCGVDKGERKRTWTQSVAAQFGGTQCAYVDQFVETQVCDLDVVKPCPPVDCVGEFSAETDCTAATCGTHDGTSSRTFHVKTPASWGGKECEHKDGEVVTSACANAVNFAECPVDCVGKWSYWSGCVGDQPCGCKNGHRTRTYQVAIAAAHGGKECPVKDGEQEKEQCILKLEHQKLCGSEFRDAPCVEMQTLYEKAEKLKCKLQAILYALGSLPEKN